MKKNTKHEFAASISLAIEYFESIIPVRLSASNELLDLRDVEYYLGSWETKTAKPYKGEANFDFLTVWIPDLSFAKTWEKLLK